MRHVLRQALAAATIAATAPAVHAQQAQQAAVVSGRVTSEGGAPVAAATVFITSLGAGAQTGTDGRYTFTVPAARIPAEPVTITARLVGFTPASATITLRGGAITQDFALVANALRLDEIVVTGAGTATTRERLGTSINSVDSSLIRRQSTPQNLVSALAGAAPNVDVRTQSGEPGASASIRIRGATSVLGTNQPLFVVDGQPIDNQTVSSQQGPTDYPGSGGTVTQNRAADINPNDIASVEILKGAAASAIYGARAANGVVLITTKRGAPGETRWTYGSTWTFDRVDPGIELQRKYGLGTGGVAATCSTDNCVPVVGAATPIFSWGPALAPGTQTYDHLREVYDTGITSDNVLQVSGGTDRTTFFLSGGLTAQDGVLRGPNNSYNRATVRLKGTHALSSRVTVGGNFNYIDTEGQFVQQGSNTSGILLGSLRTPPDFDNKQYLDPNTGYHQSYRFRNPTEASLTTGRGYDNPFFTLNNAGNRSELGRFIGNANVDWNALDWLRVSYTLGVDYFEDDRLEALPFTASTNPIGQVIRFTNNNREIDHNLLAVATRDVTDWFTGRLTLGQNLNARRYRSVYALGQGLIAPAPLALQNTLSASPPTEFRSRRHVEGYFGQAELDLYDQLYVTLGLRNDGFSTFGESDRRANYPKASLAWTFTTLLGQQGIEIPGLTFGKLRAAYGETGREPPVYQTITALSGTSVFGSGFGDFINSSQGGQGGLTTGFTLGNENLRPERNRETELGLDLGLWAGRVDLGVTWYDRNSEDVILTLPINQGQFGAGQRLANAGKISNTGIEATLTSQIIARDDLAWTVGLNFGRNRGRVDELANGIEFIGYNLEGFSGSGGSSTVGYAPGVIRGFDFARCGITSDNFAVGGGATLGEACAGQPRGALYVGSNGRPITDPTERVIADPNPDWTGGLTTTLQLFRRWNIGAIADVRRGNEVWNGTRSSLYTFGTHKDTEYWRERSATIRDLLGHRYPTIIGPGADTPTFTDAAGAQSWFTGPGGIGGPRAQHIEDGSFVKLREISVSYLMDQPWVRQRLNLTSIDVRLAGRNLATWTDYSGLDPETSLGGAEYLTQGFDFFNNPQTRSFVVSFSFNR